MDSSDPSLDLTAEVEDPKAIVSLNVSPVAEGNRYPPIGPPSDVAIAKNKEIKALRLKARNQEQAGELAAMENVSLRGQLKNREEELNDLKDTVETFEAEKAMAVNGAKVVARWELMQECLNGQTDSWDPANVLVQYKTVKITEAELLGLPTPSFEGEPQVPGDMEAEKMPEPAADDPPAS
ncbi:hypothetical protein Bca4012_097592 [Brassica carinata]